MAKEPRERVVYVKVLLSRGGFPSECLFRIDEISLSGIVPIDYCLDEHHKQLPGEIPQGQTIPGFVVGLELLPRAKSDARVYLPNAELYLIKSSLVTAARDTAHV